MQGEMAATSPVSLRPLSLMCVSELKKMSIVCPATGLFFVPRMMSISETTAEGIAEPEDISEDDAPCNPFCEAFLVPSAKRTADCDILTLDAVSEATAKGLRSAIIRTHSRLTVIELETHTVGEFSLWVCCAASAVRQIVLPLKCHLCRGLLSL